MAPRRYEEGYEPYVIIHRRYVPWYDERFVGYRKNKVVHLLYLSSSGIQWVVHPRAFAVHSPHPRARTWKVTHKTGLWDQVRAAGLGRLGVPRHGAYSGKVLCWAAQALPQHLSGVPLPAHAVDLCLPTFPTRLPQLAEIYDQAKEGMFQGTYLPVSMYSCGEHTAGPLMRARPTFLSATA